MEYIIKYTGDILSLGYPTELLDAQFAIMELEPDQAERLLEHSQVTCYEPERSLSCMADRAMEVSCIPPVQRGTGLGLTGKGVFIGLVDSGMDLSHPEFLGEDGISRVTAFWDMGAREGTPPPGFLHGAAYSGEAIAAGQVPALQDNGGVGASLLVDGKPLPEGEKGGIPQFPNGLLGVVFGFPCLPGEADDDPVLGGIGIDLVIGNALGDQAGADHLGGRLHLLVGGVVAIRGGKGGIHAAPDIDAPADIRRTFNIGGCQVPVGDADPEEGKVRCRQNNDGDSEKGP